MCSVATVVDGVGTGVHKAAIDTLAIRPVCTAQPTDANLRSSLTKLRRVADVLAVPTAPGSRARERQDCELAGLIGLIWQTDELRGHKRIPAEEVGNAVFSWKS